MKLKIAIIGGNGFVGKNFTSYFSEMGYKVIVADHSIKKLSTNNVNIKYCAIDIHHTNELINSIKDADYILWLVHASVPSTNDDSLVDDFTLNVSPIIKFLEKSTELKNLKKFIYLSSGGTIYGNTKLHIPIKESHSQKPISNYGLSKSIAEKYIEYITRNKSYETIILRPSNVYGPYQNLVKPQGIIGFAFKAIKNNLTLDLYDDGKVIRDFIYVKDLANAVLFFLNNNSISGKTSFFNVGSGEGKSIKEILKDIEEITGQKLQLNHKISRNFDCEYNVLNNSYISDISSWKQETDLKQGLIKVWEWIKNED